MVRKSALVFGIVFSAWFVLDLAATNAEACGGCRRRCCRTSCCSATPVCGSCCGGGSYYGAPTYAAPIYGTSGCSSCSAGINYVVPGSYAYALRVAPSYGPSYILSRAGVPSATYASSAGYPSYAVPVAPYRTNSVFRTSYAAPLR